MIMAKKVGNCFLPLILSANFAFAFFFKIIIIHGHEFETTESQTVHTI